ncbi:MAG: glycosyltransferase [Candidatus Omnitrophota bacterium]|nr:MAG: glycosyltransferase [Candidatus Omnitrophota bacterium]
MNISVIIPVYNEEENIPLLYEELIQVLENIGSDYEVIFVDDGSTDSSLEILKEIKERNPRVKILSLERNTGLSSALKAGIDKASGEVIITMDGDLQNDPQDIPKLLNYIQEGYDVVSGWRRYRKDPFLKRGSSIIANYIRNKLTSESINDSSCMLKVYKSEYLKKIKFYRGWHRFLPTLLKMEGARVIEVEVTHRPRTYGQSKYGIKNRLIKPFIDTLVVAWLKNNRISYKIKEEI